MKTKSYLALTPRTLIALALTLAVTRAAAAATDFRIANYNLDSDTQDFVGINQQTNLETVLQGIGSEDLNDNGTPNAQPLDILGVEELQNGEGTATADTLATIVSNLNANYGAGVYAADATTDPTTGKSVGNGANGLVYNTTTIQVVSAAPLGTVSSSGEARAPMEYTLHPIGYSSAANFTVIVSHMKSGTGTGNMARRSAEATVIASAITSLGSSAHVIVMGDFNFTSGSTEAGYQTLITKLDDVALPSQTWNDSTTAGAKAISPLLSESATDVLYRDDIQFVSPAADPASPSASAGLQYDSGSILAFGNGGATSLYENTITSTTDNPGVFPDLTATQRTTILTAETNATDHLPIVADYSLVGVTPVAQAATWITNRTGNWSLNTNWLGNVTPNNASPLSYAVTINAGTAALDINPTINSLTLNSPGTLTGNGNLTLATATISGNYNLTGTTTIAADPITNTPAGTITFNSATNNAGPFTGPAGAGAILINPGASLTAGAITINQLTVSGNLTLRANSAASKLTTLTLAGSSGNWTGSLDLTSNKLIIEAPNAPTKAADILALQNQIKSFGQAGSFGITSSTLTAAQAIAVVDNNALTNPYTSFGGINNLDTNAILITTAFRGDANLDGVVDIQDLTTVANNWQQPVTNWAQGDFNNDGVVDIQDLTAVANNWQAGVISGGGSSFSEALSELPDFGKTAAAPEPASLVLLALGTLFLATPRRRGALKLHARK